MLDHGSSVLLPLAIVDANKKRCASRAYVRWDPLTISKQAFEVCQSAEQALRRRPRATRANQGCSRQRRGAMAAVVDKEPEIVDESDGDDDVPEDVYDDAGKRPQRRVRQRPRRQHVAVRQERSQERAARRPQSCEYWPVPRHKRDHGTGARPENSAHLFKLLQRNAFAKLEGCLSTGKEANVYYALSGDGLRDIEATKDIPTKCTFGRKSLQDVDLSFSR